MGGSSTIIGDSSTFQGSGARVVRDSELEALNRDRWDQLVRKGNMWTVPVTAEQIAAARDGDVSIVLTPRKTVPQENWLRELRGRRVLCLAGGGGQQAPLLAAAGARVTTLDNSPLQLTRDREVAEREGLEIRTELGVMEDLSMFPRGVLRPGGESLFGLLYRECPGGLAGGLPGFVPGRRINHWLDQSVPVSVRSAVVGTGRVEGPLSNALFRRDLFT